MEREKPQARLSCNYCSKTYAFKSGLSRHLTKAHAEEIKKTELNAKVVIQGIMLRQ